MARERATDTGALVAAAAEAFRAKGYSNATIDDIAETAGISRPTVYKYARSKQHLLDLVVEQIIAYLDGRLHDVVNRPGDPQGKLRQLIDIHVESACTNRTLYAILFSEHIEVSEVTRRRFREWARRVTRDFQLLIAGCAGVDYPIDTEVTANLILSMLTSLSRWYNPDGRCSREQLVHQIELLLQPILGPPTSDGAPLSDRKPVGVPG